MTEEHYYGSQTLIKIVEETFIITIQHFMEAMWHHSQVLFKFSSFQMEIIQIPTMVVHRPQIVQIVQH
jgi:hypothetical protein